MIVAGLIFAQQNPPSRGRDVAKLYTEKCASCHRAEMAGGSASSLVDAIWRYGGDDASIANSIRDGHPEAGMPAMEKDLDAPEMRGLVIYIREQAASLSCWSPLITTTSDV
jgi:mono/diheme cytochrome c family protein